MLKQRRRWTPEEDDVLLAEVDKLTTQGRAKDWTAIAEALPGRSNKDCRKRWFNNLVGGLKKGPWDMDEDERLRAGFREYGDQWTLVAEEVGGRSADQCAKRWHHFLNPTLDQSKWTEEEEQLLLRAVERHGRCWRLIQTEYFPGRASNNVKNRYVTMTRRRSGPPTQDSTLNEISDQTCYSRQDHLNLPASNNRDAILDNTAPPSLYQRGMTMSNYSDTSPYMNQQHPAVYHNRSFPSYSNISTQAHVGPPMPTHSYSSMGPTNSLNSNPYEYHATPTIPDGIDTSMMSSSMGNFDNYLSTAPFGHGYGHGMTVQPTAPEISSLPSRRRSQTYGLAIDNPSPDAISNSMTMLTRSNRRF